MSYRMIYRLVETTGFLQNYILNYESWKTITRITEPPGENRNIDNSKRLIVCQSEQLRIIN